MRRFTLFPALKRDLGRHASLSLGPLFSYADSSDTREDSVLGTEPPYGFGTFSETGFQVALTYDDRNPDKVLQPGLQWRTEAAWLPDLGDVESPYGFIDGAVGWHAAPSPPLLLSFYAGGRKVWGDFPFFQAAYLGAQGNSRGYRWNRFAGEGSLYGSAELRWAFTQVRAFIPGELGLVALADVGRVFVDADDPSRWHPTAGVGLFYAPFERKMIFQIGVTEGREDTFLVVSGGISFAGLD